MLALRIIQFCHANNKQVTAARPILAKNCIIRSCIIRKLRIDRP
jgi:hypothetical protein